MPTTQPLRHTRGGNTLNPSRRREAMERAAAASAAASETAETQALRDDFEQRQRAIEARRGRPRLAW
jgi:hypothetical protein